MDLLPHASHCFLVLPPKRGTRDVTMSPCENRGHGTDLKVWGKRTLEGLTRNSFQWLLLGIGRVDEEKWILTLCTKVFCGRCYKECVSLKEK